ncbi:MAG: preprotein translocase subunit SecA, partial [Rhodoglobus sp.]|nr:preprotein translocase subunit SecA [Rhodoglobus sp.]
RAMAQRDPLGEYQREGFALYQSRMGSIRDEAVGFLFNLEVEVTGGATGPTVQARGLQAAAAPTNQLTYTAPSEDASGDLEVRNQRGQVERGATALAQQQQAAQQQPQQPAARGAFGQRTDGNAPPPQNRAERRAQEKRGQ